MKDLFNNLFGKKKEVVPKVITDTNIEKEPPKRMGVEDLHLNKAKIEKLQKDRKEKIEEHRQAVSDLESHGVIEITDNKRSKTYNEYLSPIEQELSRISKELLDTREVFDMKQSRSEILEGRIQTLKELGKSLEEKFAATEIGTEYNAYLENKKRIQKEQNALHPEIAYSSESMEKHKDLNNQRIEADKDFEYKIKEKKEFMDYARAADRINRMMSDTEILLHDVKDDQYDETGFMRVK